jgi:hypothetical protein
VTFQGFEPTALIVGVDEVVESCERVWPSHCAKHQFSEGFVNPCGLMRTAETDHWRSTPETAGWLRGRIENILDAAKASKHIASPWENPALWRGNLIQLLPRRPKKSQVRHHPPMPFEHLPAFTAWLRTRPAFAARALELSILFKSRDCLDCLG